MFIINWLLILLHLKHKITVSYKKIKFNLIIINVI